MGQRQPRARGRPTLTKTFFHSRSAAKVSTRRPGARPACAAAAGDDRGLRARRNGLVARSSSIVDGHRRQAAIALVLLARARARASAALPGSTASAKRRFASVYSCAAVDERRRRKGRELGERGAHLRGRAFEEPPAAAGEERIPGERDRRAPAAAKIRDLARRVRRERRARKVRARPTTNASTKMISQWWSTNDVNHGGNEERLSSESFQGRSVRLHRVGMTISHWWWGSKTRPTLTYHILDWAIAVASRSFALRRVGLRLSTRNDLIRLTDRRLNTCNGLVVVFCSCFHDPGIKFRVFGKPLILQSLFSIESQKHSPDNGFSYLTGRKCVIACIFNQRGECDSGCPKS